VNPIQSRRRFLGALSAGAASAITPAAVAATLAPAAETPPIAPAPAVTGPSPDAALMQLFDECMSTVAEYRRAYGLYERGRDEHQAKHPMPEVMLVRPEDTDLGLPDKPGDGSSYRWCIRELRQAEWPVYDEIDAPDGTQFWSVSGGTVFRRELPSAAARARADEIIEAHDKWHTRYWRTPREARSFERQADRLSKRKDKLRAKIDRTRARTVAGLAAKAQVAAIEGEEDTQFADTTLESIQRDMRKLNPAALRSSSRRARAS
jgi:hypothetical protein